jgi:hypothetical protein
MHFLFFTLLVSTMKNMLFTYFIPIGIIMIGIYFSFWTSIFKDESQNNIKPYSFARAQLM